MGLHQPPWSFGFDSQTRGPTTLLLPPRAQLCNRSCSNKTHTNNTPTNTPGGLGRLRSWSGPVETDFQGRLRFSYANRPARAPTDTFTGQARAKPARNRCYGCKLLSVVRLSSSHCTRPHPCTVTAAHHPHTRPPDIPARLSYQRSLMNTYSTSDLRRSAQA
jgi:hypothetical protein